MTDAPIYAVLSQPYTSTPENPDELGNFPSAGAAPLNGTFIMMSHVKYLQAGGARIVPLCYRLDANSLNSILSQVNGVYIPGDSQGIL